MPNAHERPSSHAAFWNERYDADDFVFGRRPSEFVERQAWRLDDGSDVVELGAGEGRNLVYLALEGGHRVWAVDYAADGLRKARAFAREQGVDLHVVEADVLDWEPQRRWDAVVVTFLQLLPDERPRLYALIRRLLRPGGLLLARWFRPDHLEGPYARVGPSAADRMVPLDEIREHFYGEELLVAEPRDVNLEEGPVLRGRVAVVDVVARMRTSEASG